ncbi:MAG: GDSL family lipase [Desulfobacterales bacterium]|nr:GDSL family lipase [Desulfobacterales bacterium]
MANRFLFMGDSLIEFFNWQERFSDREVFNYGIAGETAEGLLARLPNIINRVQSPDLVMIMTGINNVAMEDYGFLFTYKKIITRLREAYGQAIINMTSLLPVDLFFLGDAIPRINRRLKEIAENNIILYLDLYPLFIDENSRAITSCFEADGVHLSAEGYEIWARALENTIFPCLD